MRTAGVSEPRHRRGSLGRSVSDYLSRRRRGAVAAFALALVPLLVSGCTGIGEIARVIPIGDDPPPALIDHLPGSPAGPATAEMVLGTAMEKFKNADSFRFQASAIHQWELDGNLHEWVFVGGGAYSAADGFFSRMEGPADTDLRLWIIDGRIFAEDTRGPIANPSSAFGGPGQGASPFTVIAYLRNYQQASQLQVASLGDEQVFTMTFVPNLSSVAALDAGQASTLARVSEISGQVWVDKSNQRITQEQVTVRYSEPNGAQSAVEMTLRFSAFDEPVEIERQSP